MDKRVVVGGIAIGVVAVGAGVVYCHRDFAEAAAAGDFERAERRAGLLAINDIVPAPRLAFMLVTAFLGLALLMMTR